MRWVTFATLLIFCAISLSFELSPYFFGVNYWYFERLSEGEQRTVIELLKDLPVDVIRIGGMWYDVHGIKTWVLRDFFDLCEELNATPIVQIPFNGKSPDVVEEFVEKVRRVYDGPVIWSIGNEMDLYPDSNIEWLEREDREDALRRYGEFLRELRKIERDAKVIGPDFSHRWRPWAIGNWTRPFLKRYGDSIDVFTVHRYPFHYVTTTSEIVQDAISFYSEMSALKRYVGKEIGLTETNLSWDWKFCGPMSPEGDWAGLWLASILVRAMVLNLWNVSIWSVVNDSCISMIAVEGGRVTLRGTYRALRVFKGVPRNVTEHFLSKYIDYVILGKDTAIVVNRSGRDVSVKLNDGRIVAGKLSVSRYHLVRGVWRLEERFAVGVRE